MSDSDDEPQLSASTLAILNEFLVERKERETQLNNIVDTERTELVFDENWQLSQFWYDEDTVNNLVHGAINSTSPDDKIALISCPTLYKKLKENCGSREIKLFEYDERFKAFGEDFILYDYKSPLQIPRELSNYFDLVISDPPFLSEECLTKTAVTIKYLCKKNIILCTGAIMANTAERLLHVKKCNFEPHHRNNLANEFYCYSNFDFDQFLK